MVQREMKDRPSARLTGVLRQLDIAASSWCRRLIPAEQRQRPGPKRKPVPNATSQAVVKMATENPWYGYKRIGVMCRRDGAAWRGKRPSGFTAPCRNRRFW